MQRLTGGASLGCRDGLDADALAQREGHPRGSGRRRIRRQQTHEPAPTQRLQDQRRRIKGIVAVGDHHGAGDDLLLDATQPRLAVIDVSLRVDVNHLHVRTLALHHLQVPERCRPVPVAQDDGALGSLAQEPRRSHVGRVVLMLALHVRPGGHDLAHQENAHR